MVTKQEINELKESVDIVDIISEDISLEKASSNYKGLCPFHDDTNASLVVSQEKQIFTCFSCGATGNVINYLRNKHNLLFIEALEILAKKSNKEFKYSTNKKKIELNKIHYINNDLLKFYKAALATTKEGDIYRAYLQSRNISRDTIEQFEIGAAVNNTELVNDFFNIKISKENNYKKNDLKDANIFNSTNKEFFNNRLTIPIKDEYDRVVGFSGRELNPTANIKYLNSKESDIFKKKNILFNLNNAKKTLFNNNELILCEGYFDVISLSQNGYNNSVALMGTKLSEEHIKLIKKYKVKKITLCLDNDIAGMNATINIASRLLENGISDIKVINIPNGIKDIDELLNKKEIKLEEIKDNYFDHFISKIHNFDKIEQKNKLSNKIMEQSTFLNKVEQKNIESKLINQNNLNVDKLIEQLNLLDKVTTLEEVINIKNKILKDIKPSIKLKEPKLEL